MTLPKNASKQVPEWRIREGHRHDPDTLPLQAKQRQWYRHMEDIDRHWQAMVDELKDKCTCAGTIHPGCF